MQAAAATAQTVATDEAGLRAVFGPTEWSTARISYGLIRNRLNAAHYEELRRQRVRALDGLEGHRHLHTVNVSFTRVADLGLLAGRPALAVLRLPHTAVTTLVPLASVRTLKDLDIAHTAVGDITPLRQLPALASLDLRATQVIDLAPLVDMVALRRVVVQRLEISRSAIDRLREARPEVEVID
ncbi:MAG: hypothetical protein LAT65_08635 [Saccharospirillum sp.]|nr:hypothetical protein [Saccharospirillum sp.]